MLTGKKILLVITGGIAAYKSLELIRLMRKQGANVQCIMTKGAEQFITPLSAASLSENQVYTDLWSLKDETEMGHIRLSREADLIIIAPASAGFIAKLAHGFADDLASTTLLASDKPIMICPAMNPMMWENPATQDNIKILQSRNFTQIGPEDGDMACGETGSGRMSEPDNILKAIINFFANNKPLSGYKALVTSGPTYEPIDPVRFIGNRSSGKQGHAIAQALSEAGASVTLISGPTNIPDPSGPHTIHIQTAQHMYEACMNTLPVDIAVCAAAVSDWRVDKAENEKIKKGSNEPFLSLTENPDILAAIARHKNRPNLVIGFAAETENLIKNAQAKLKSKKCDWIIANEVGHEKGFDDDENHVYLVTHNKYEEWPKASKRAIAKTLVAHIGDYLNNQKTLKAVE